MKKYRHISDEDSALFRKVAGNTKPLKQDNFIVPKPKPNMRQSTTATDNAAAMEAIRLDDFDADVLAGGDELCYVRAGIQKKILRKLRRGDYEIEAELDLHGMTVEMVKTELAGFLEQCAANSLRCVKIIHGKGRGSIDQQPILKNKVNQWLRKIDIVLAFCSAKAADGGTGAMYLLLKRV